MDKCQKLSLFGRVARKAAELFYVAEKAGERFIGFGAVRMIKALTHHEWIREDLFRVEFVMDEEYFNLILNHLIEKQLVRREVRFRTVKRKVSVWFGSDWLSVKCRFGLDPLTPKPIGSVQCKLRVYRGQIPTALWIMTRTTVQQVRMNLKYQRDGVPYILSWMLIANFNTVMNIRNGNANRAADYLAGIDTNANEICTFIPPLDAKLCKIVEEDKRGMIYLYAVVGANIHHILSLRSAELKQLELEICTSCELSYYLDVHVRNAIAWQRKHIALLHELQKIKNVPNPCGALEVVKDNIVSPSPVVQGRVLYQELFAKEGEDFRVKLVQIRTQIVVRISLVSLVGCWPLKIASAISSSAITIQVRFVITRGVKTSSSSTSNPYSAAPEGMIFTVLFL
ncbi:hypothetical protein IFM89_038692 [Coptis chinensis]|uniref:Uncharacterized protein n=1 Tax=Coptis chinensis TaxID=261450 RepID=A0A835HJK1_9MAGN|nr:hypothetical protein IFM89_038692 [Coptis chinensis]